MIDISKSLNQLVNLKGNAREYDSSLVERVNHLLAVPIRDFTVEDVRLFIRQNLFLEFLVPLALVFLRNDILIESQEYGYKLLPALLEVENTFWRSHSELYSELLEILDENFEYLKNPKNIDDTKVYQEQELPFIFDLITKFKKI